MTKKKEGSSRKKQYVGVVVSNKMEKTAVVEILQFKTHPFYKKRMKARKKYKVDNQLEAQEKDRVKIEETRPLSRGKRWRIKEILKSPKEKI